MTFSSRQNAQVIGISFFPRIFSTLATDKAKYVIWATFI